MDYVPISEKKKVVDAAQLKEGESPQRSEMRVGGKKNHYRFKVPDPAELTDAVRSQVVLWCMTA